MVVGEETPDEGGWHTLLTRSGFQGWARQKSLARDFDCDVEGGVVIRDIIEAEAINRNSKRDAVVVPTLEKPRVGQPTFFRFILPPERVRQPPVQDE